MYLPFFGKIATLLAGDWHMIHMDWRNSPLLKPRLKRLFEDIKRLSSNLKIPEASITEHRIQLSLGFPNDHISDL